MTGIFESGHDAGAREPEAEEASGSRSDRRGSR